MSVTSATETFTDGAELFDQDKYKSTVTTSLEPDPIQMEQDFKKPLSQRIIPIHSHTKSVYGEYRLDDVIVRCPSEAFREHQKQQWNAVKKEAVEDSSFYTFIALGTGALAAIGIALLAMGPSDVANYLGTTVANSPLGPVLLLAGGVVSVASIIFAANAHSSYNRANDEVNKWDADPVVKVGHARNEAHEHGFPYIYANNLKLGQGPSHRALFHPIQVEYAYKKYFESFCSKLLNQFNPSVDSWMNQFRSCNPISSGYMLYGLGRIPDRMKLVIEDYTRFASLLENLVNTYDQLKADVRRTAKERIDSYTKTKNDQLQPLAQTRDKGIADAEAAKDKVLRDPEASDSRRREARDTFTAIKEALKDNYTRNAVPINKKYDGKIKEVEKERDERLIKLDGQKSSQLGNNYRAARELLERAQQAWDNKGYQPVNFQQYFPYQTTQPVWVHQQPVYQQPVYQQQQPYIPPAQNVYPQYVNPGYGQFGFGHAAQIPAQQQYFYVQPTAPQYGG